MSYGITVTQCMSCSKKEHMYGWLPFAIQIWNQDEGALCCGEQTIIVRQEEK